MGVNAYSKGPVAPAFQSNYISQHVGLPLEYIGAALQAKQEKYDHFLQGVNGLGTEVMGIQGIVPSDAAYVAKAKEGYNQQIQELSQQDGTRPEVQRAYQNLVHNLASDKTLNAIRGNYAQLGEKQAQAQKLKADGKYHYSHGQLQTRALQEYEANGGAAGGANLQLEDFTPEVDVMKEYNDIYNVMKPSEREALGMLAAGDEGAIAYKTSHGGIDAQQAFQTARAALETHRNSAGGRQKFLDAKAMGATDEQAHAYVAQQLYSRGGAYTFSKSSTNADGALNKIGDLARAKKAKKEEEEGYTMMSGFSAPVDNGKEPEYDSQGNFRTQKGGFEIGAQAYANRRAHGQNLLQSLTGAAGATLAGSGIFGDDLQQGIEKMVNLPKEDLQKQYELDMAHRQQLQQKGLPAPAPVSPEEWYKESHQENEARNYDVPVLTTSKGQSAAYDQVVKSGYINNALLIDPATQQQYTGKDLIKFEDGKVKNEIQVVSSPNAKWSTQYDPNSVMVNIDGKAYIMAASAGLRQRAPRSVEEAQMINQTNMDWLKSKKYGSFPFYKVGNDGKLEVIPVKGHFNPSYMHEPQLLPDSE